MRYPSRPWDRIDELPETPGVYIVWSALSDLTGRPLYVGMTKRDVQTRLEEHVRDDTEAVPLLTSMATVEFRQCVNGRHARALERELIEELNPHYGQG